MKRNPTINDVAQLANVSRGTVSNYINGITIREENKAKIEKAIAELKYVPNARARELKTSKTSTVVLIVPTTWSPFFAELVYRMQVELDRIGFKMILANSHADPDEEEELLRMASLNQVTGVITMSYSNIYNFINIGKKLNLVSIERFISEDVPLITSDNYGGGQLAAEKLITFGSKRFLLLRRKTNHYNATDKRTEGFLHIMKENNLPVDIFEASLKENYIEEFIHYLKTHFSGDVLTFDGIFGVTDEYAVIAKQVLFELNPSYLNKVNIIGFDGSKSQEKGSYQIASIRQPVEAMVKAAVKVLKKLIDGEEVPSHYSKVFDVSFVEPERLV